MMGKLKVTTLKVKMLWEEKPDSLSCNISQMAGQLKMSCRTLQRRLQEEETCYLTLQDQARFDLTRRLFEIGKSVEEVSETLGFSDRRCFTRAFKRWTGDAPRDFKKCFCQKPSPTAVKSSIIPYTAS